MVSKVDLCLDCSTRLLGIRVCGICMEAEAYRVRLRREENKK